MVPQVGVHLFKTRPLFVFILRRVLVPFEDALRFPQEASIVGGVSSLRGRSAVVTWGLVYRLVGPGSPVVGSIFPHLEKIGTAAEEDFLCPSMGFP